MKKKAQSATDKDIEKAALALHIYNESTEFNIKIAPKPANFESIMFSALCPCGAKIENINYEKLSKGYECKCGAFIYLISIHEDHYHIERKAKWKLPDNSDAKKAEIF